MDIPFKLTFFSNDSPGVEFNKFSTTLDEALENFEEHCYSCKELQDLRVKFEGEQASVELWIEIMDMLPEQSFKDSEVELGYFLPSEDIRGLYLNFKSPFNIKKLDYSCLLPGIYRIVVTVNKDDKYYAFLKVNPSRINEEQLNLMREEVENIVNGLAKEVATKRSLMVTTNSYNNNDLLQKYHFLIAQSETLITNIKLILKEPRYKIIKRYVSKSVGQPTRNDAKTTQLKQSKHTQAHKVPSYNYELDYNLSINSNLKKMLEEFLKNTFFVEKYIDENNKLLLNELFLQKKYKSPIDEIERKMEILKEHSVKLKQLKANLLFALKKDWIENIDANLKNQDKLPRVPYYRTIYSLYLQLTKDNTLEINPFEYYIYYWKETSKLYEIWGFLKILLMLKENEELNFNETSGWIFDSTDSSRHLLLAPNTKISLSNSKGLKLILFYDSFIPKPDEEADPPENRLISVENSNRPDFRMDIYYEGLFRGSILADFKYRSLGKLGNPDVYINNRYTEYGYKVYKQLMDYTYTRSFYLNRNTKSMYSDFAVRRVLGIFPKDNESISFNRDTVTNIIRCSLSPGMKFDKIESEFLEIIKDVVNISSVSSTY